MAELSFPNATYNSGAVTDAEYQRLPWVGDGLIGGPWESGGSVPVYANSSGMEIHVRANRYGFVLGRAWESGASEITKSIGANSSGSTRMDTLVLRLDRSTWQVRLAVRAGTPGAGVPTLVRDTGDTGLFEVPIADITVPNGAASIAAGNVRMRAYYTPSALRAVHGFYDLPNMVNPGDILFDWSTLRWTGWTGFGPVVFGTQDSGDLALTVATADWDSIGSNVGRKVNGVVTLDFNLELNGPGVIPEGNVDASGVQMAVIPTALRPASRFHYFSCTLTGNIFARIQVQPDGDVKLFHSNAALPAGVFLRATCTYVP